MAFFFKRYVVDYIIFAVLGIIAWSASIWYFDLYIPWILGVLLLIFLIAYIPYVMHQDYLKVKDIWLDYGKMKTNEISKETFQKNVIKKITEEIGIPEFIAEKILNKVIKEKPMIETQSTSQI